MPKPSEEKLSADADNPYEPPQTVRTDRRKNLSTTAGVAFALGLTLLALLIAVCGVCGVLILG